MPSKPACGGPTIPTRPERPSAPPAGSRGAGGCQRSDLLRSKRLLDWIFGAALFDLLSPMEIWHAQAAAVSGGGRRAPPPPPPMLSGSSDEPSGRGALATLAQSGVNGTIRSWLQTERITVHHRLWVCFGCFNWERRAAASITWARLIHSSCSGKMQTQLKKRRVEGRLSVLARRRLMCCEKRELVMKSVIRLNLVLERVKASVLSSEAGQMF